MVRKIISTFVEISKDSRSTGILLLICTAVSLWLSNGISGGYLQVWNNEFPSFFTTVHLPHTLLHIINDVFMPVFFLQVGMEIKRELLDGELKSFKKSLLPVVGALGGMVVPAAIYLIITRGTPYSNGWGIPIATDIAFSLGVLSLLGKRVPLSLRIFLMALAIIDDLGGIVAIALFYAQGLHFIYVILSAVLLAVLGLINKYKVKHLTLYFVVGMLLWYCVYNSGINATIAGVLLAFALPLAHIPYIEHKLHVPVNFIILPLFALANTAILLPTDFSAAFSSSVHKGILLGLLVGKPLGIVLFCYLAVRMRIAALPTHTSWRQLWGVGMVAGVGFTISIFMTHLAFDDPATQTIAKVAVIIASLLSGVIGVLWLSNSNKL
jgi:NhaA family Na+:H+ antiporter